MKTKRINVGEKKREILGFYVILRSGDKLNCFKCVDLKSMLTEGKTLLTFADFQLSDSHLFVCLSDWMLFRKEGKLVSNLSRILP